MNFNGILPQLYTIFIYNLSPKIMHVVIIRMKEGNGSQLSYTMLTYTMLSYTMLLHYYF